MFILVPGFWLGAWAWANVACLLRAAGHDVEAVTLPGLAKRTAPRAASPSPTTLRPSPRSSYSTGPA